MSDFLNSLYNTQENQSSDSQCTGMDFLQSQNSIFDLNRYVKENNNSKNLEMIKEEEIFSQFDEKNLEHIFESSKKKNNTCIKTSNLPININNNKYDNYNNQMIDNQKNNNQKNNFLNEENKNQRIDQKITILSQEIDEIEFFQMEDSKSKQILNLNQQNLPQMTSNNLNNNDFKNKSNMNCDANTFVNYKNFANNSNFPNEDKKSQRKINSLNNNELNNSKKKNDLINESKFSSNVENIYDNHNRDIYLKIQKISEDFLKDIDLLRGKFVDRLEKYKLKFLNDIDLIYKIIREDTCRIINEEEKNKLIDNKIQMLLKEMIGILSEIQN